LRSYGGEKSQDVQIFAFFGKTTPCSKISKFCSKRLSLHRLTCCIQSSLNFADGKSVKSRVIRVTKKKQNLGCLKNCRYCADRAQNLPGPSQQCSQSASDLSKSVHFQRSYSRTREHRQIAPYRWRGVGCLVASVCLFVCLSVCPRSKRNTVSAISTKVGRHIVRDRTLACTDAEVKGQILTLSLGLEF